MRLGACAGRTQRAIAERHVLWRRQKQHAFGIPLAAYDADAIRRIERRRPVEDEFSVPRRRGVKERWSEALLRTRQTDLA